MKIKLATVDTDSCTLTSQQVTKASCPYTCAYDVPKAGYEVLFVIEDATNQLLFPLLNNSFLLISRRELDRKYSVQRAFTLRIAFVITCNFSTDSDVILEYISVCYCFDNHILYHNNIFSSLIFNESNESTNDVTIGKRSTKTIITLFCNYEREENLNGETLPQGYKNQCSSLPK